MDGTEGSEGSARFRRRVPYPSPFYSPPPHAAPFFPAWWRRRRAVTEADKPSPWPPPFSDPDPPQDKTISSVRILNSKPRPVNFIISNKPLSVLKVYFLGLRKVRLHGPSPTTDNRIHFCGSDPFSFEKLRNLLSSSPPTTHKLLI